MQFGVLRLPRPTVQPKPAGLPSKHLFIAEARGVTVTIEVISGPLFYSLCQFVTNMFLSAAFVRRVRVQSVPDINEYELSNVTDGDAQQNPICQRKSLAQVFHFQPKIYCGRWSDSVCSGLHRAVLQCHFECGGPEGRGEAKAEPDRRQVGGIDLSPAPSHSSMFMFQIFKEQVSRVSSFFEKP